MRAPMPALLAGALLTLLAATRAPAADEAERVAWLRGHAIPIATLDPASDRFDDLVPLRAVLGGVRLVMLGEALRGDGTALLAKARLVRFLHQQLGFDVIVFECGLYDCARAWEAIRGGGDVRQQLRGVLFPF